ncbi:MAG: hypothetical protein IJO29_08525 [Oscillospiraceae bacterium]|nr:hypothetical protein [Oscillospiraceae bacterium]
MKNKETFSYIYSAKEQAEIKRIREKYVFQEADKMEQLRRLDASVTQKGTVISLAAGVIGALILGLGMCCCLVWTNFIVLGIIVGIIGIIAVCSAYPLYNYVTKIEREKIAPEIIRLTDELMK